MSDEENPKLKVQRELLILEYTHCVERYENIYKALWQNFNYLGLLAAAVLTFGATKFEWHLAATLSGVPLFFWYLIQFWPLDLYGRRVRARTAEIERTLNHIFFKKEDDTYDEFIFLNGTTEVPIRIALSHYEKFYPSQARGSFLRRWVLALIRMLKRFGDFLQYQQWGPRDEIVPIRTRMHLAFVLLLSIWLYPANLTWRQMQSSGVASMIKDTAPTVRPNNAP